MDKHKLVLERKNALVQNYLNIKNEFCPFLLVCFVTWHEKVPLIASSINLILYMIF